MLDLELRRATFGEGTPYSYEHGSFPECIMKLDRKEIANYHRRVYTTDNLRIIVSGGVDEARLLSALSSAVDAAVVQGASQNCEQHPFIARLPALPPTNPSAALLDIERTPVEVGSS
jgi:Zn-dependent M16 (insulinase) family peptidase